MKRIKKLFCLCLMLLCICGSLLIGTNALLEDPTLPEHILRGVPSWDADEGAIRLDFYLEGIPPDLRVLAIHIEALPDTKQLSFHQGVEYLSNSGGAAGAGSWIPDFELFMFSIQNTSGYRLRADGKIASFLFFVEPGVSEAELIVFPFDFVQVLLLEDDMLLHPNSYTIRAEDVYFYRDGTAAAAPTPTPTPTFDPGSTRIPVTVPPETGSPTSGAGSTPTPIPERTTRPSPSPRPNLLGDADDNGIVNAADAAAILRHLVKLKMLTEQGLANADADGNGIVNAADAAAILRWLVKLDAKTAIGLSY